MNINRSDWVDYAKGFGIILVVYGHLARGLVSAGILPDSFNHVLLDSIIYSFHMPLFFFLSGLFFLNSLIQRSPISLIVNKIDTIAYPYVLWSLVQGIIEVNFSKQKSFPVSYAQVAMLFESPRAQFWFLYILFTILVISAILYQRTRKADSLGILIIAGILYAQPYRTQYGQIVALIANNFVYFALGAYAGKYLDLQRLRNPIYLWVFLIAAALLQFIFHGIWELRYRDIGLASLMVAFASICATLALTLRMSQHHPLLQWIGRNSMAIFLMHLLAASGVRIALFNGLGISNPWIHVVLGMVAGVFFPLLVVKALGDKGKILWSAPWTISAQRLHGRLLKRS